jgi:phosphomannomutase
MSLVLMEISNAIDAKIIMSNPTIDFKAKKIFIADLDNTLTKSKQPIDDEMKNQISLLMQYKPFAVISGASFFQLKKQVIDRLSGSPNVANLYIIPACATRFYIFKDGEWKELYAEDLGEDEKATILDSFEKTFKEMNYKHPEKIYGDLFEDKGSQITFSGLGQQSPLEVKGTWDPDRKKRMEIRNVLTKYLPNYQITIGGNTSIDVTRKGIDKAYGIEKIKEILKYSTKEMIFIGDALYEGGNDYPVRTTGVDCIQVADDEEGKRLMRFIVDSVKR